MNYMLRMFLISCSKANIVPINKCKLKEINYIAILKKETYKVNRTKDFRQKINKYVT